MCVDEDHQPVSIVSLTIAIILGFVFAIKLLKASRLKKIRLVQTQLGEPPGMTYCTISYYQLVATDIMLVGIILSLFFLAICLLLGDSYQQLNYSKKQLENCEDTDWHYLQPINWLDYGIINFVYQAKNTTFMLQIFEWIAMIYLISTQKGRRIEEILYDHNAENIQKPLTILEFSKAYRRIEMKMSTCFIFTYILQSLGYLCLQYGPFFGLFILEYMIIDYCFYIISLSFFFLVITICMRRLHFYEYNRI